MLSIMDYVNVYTVTKGRVCDYAYVRTVMIK